MAAGADSGGGIYPNSWMEVSHRITSMYYITDNGVKKYVNKFLYDGAAIS